MGKIPKNRDAKISASLFVELAKQDTDLASDVIAAYIKEDRKRVESGEISSQTIPNHIKSIKVLLDANRIPIHWKSLHKLLPRREDDSFKGASLLIYRGDSESYWTFITPEACIALDLYREKWKADVGKYPELDDLLIKSVASPMIRRQLKRS